LKIKNVKEGIIGQDNMNTENKRGEDALFFMISQLVAILIFVWDFKTPSGPIVWMFYIIPISLSLKMGVFFTVINTLLTNIYLLTALFNSLPYLLPQPIVVYNRLMGLTAGWILTVFLLYIKKLRNAFELSNASFQELIDKNPDGVIVMDKKGKVLFVNSTLQSISGRPAREYVGEILGIPLVNRESAEVNVAFRSGKTKFAEIRVVESWWQTEKANIIFLRDITERKQAEEVLKRDNTVLEALVEEKTRRALQMQQEVERAKRLSDIGTLAATIAHELRNPLAAISLAALNIGRKAQNPDLAPNLENIQKKITESDKIINNLLFYSRLRPPHLEKIFINALLEECVEAAQKQTKKKLAIQRDLATTQHQAIEADPLQIKELFSNLLNNAIDAVPEGQGQITIQSFSEEIFLKFIVKDNGDGIDRNMLEKIFDPFFSTKAKGTGLGLSVCRQIVDLHRGRLEIESEKKKGTVVHLWLLKSIAQER